MFNKAQKVIEGVLKVTAIAVKLNYGALENHLLKSSS